MPEDEDRNHCRHCGYFVEWSDDSGTLIHSLGRVECPPAFGTIAERPPEPLPFLEVGNYIPGDHKGH